MFQRDDFFSGQPGAGERSAAIDLSKLTLSEIYAIWDRTKTGTPTGTFIKISSSIIGIFVFVVGFMVAAVNYFPRHDQVTRNEKSVPAPAQTAVNYAPALEVQSYIDKLREKDQLIDGLNSKVSDLQARLNKRPDYMRCLKYDNDLRELRFKKDEDEKSIQLLLNPPVTPEQRQVGTYYTADQLSVFVRQAAEFRKQADDIEKEILSTESSRSECDE